MAGKRRSSLIDRDPRPSRMKLEPSPVWFPSANTLFGHPEGVRRASECDGDNSLAGADGKDLADVRQRLAREERMTNGRDAEPAYDEANIKILTTAEAIRLRPGMYIGDTTPRGLHHLVFELVDNSIQQALAGHGTEVRVMLHADGSASVADDGSGIPVEPSQAFPGKSKLEVVLTTLHA